MPPVITISRRTDIPAFYTPWLINRLKAGYACYPNPFSGQVHRQSLRQEDVHSFLFISKNYRPFLPHFQEIEDLCLRTTYHYTITGAPQELEPRLPGWQASVETFLTLAEKTGAERIHWRFDPILITDELDPGYYLRRFRQIASALSGATRRCYFSFTAFYEKTKRNLTGGNIPYQMPELKLKQELAGELANLANTYGMTLYACCQDALISPAIQKGHCVDTEHLAKLFPDQPPPRPSKPTRKECGCAESRDIGMYDTCPHGCLYCYANQNHAVALERYRRHDPMKNTLS